VAGIAPWALWVIGEVIGKGRLDYGYQPEAPLGKVLFHLKRYGFSTRTPVGLRVPDPFRLPTRNMIWQWNRRGMNSFFRFSWW
jgi:hypothetical protein